MNKTLQEKTDHFLQFTDEEMEELKMSPGDKFSVDYNEDGSIHLKKFVPLELDLDEWSKEDLINLIQLSVKWGLDFEETIEKLLENVVNELK